jgi:hypothetical protein
MEPTNHLTETEQERLARLNRERLARDCAPHVPPEHIVSGECTFEALAAYLGRHPYDTFRAREAARMYGWFAPIVLVHQAEKWGLDDIIGTQQQGGEGKK